MIPQKVDHLLKSGASAAIRSLRFESSVDGLAIVEPTRLQKPKSGQPVLDRDTDYLQDRYGPTTSPIIRERNGPRELPIDLDRPTESPSP
jgi:hypothetical protein